MKFLLAIVITILLLAAGAYAQKLSLQEGPIVKGYSENAEAFVLDLGSEALIIQARDGFLDWNIKNLGNGKYYIRCSPINRFGEGKMTPFYLQIIGSKARYYKITPDPKLIKTDPEYLDSFSTDLELFIPR